MINDCPNEQEISAYHDEELSAERSAFIEAHLIYCEACARQLAQLKQVSKWVSLNATAGLSQIAMRRLQKKLDEVMERGLVRWAWEVSGIAAAVLIGASLWLTHVKDTNTTTASLPPWVDARVSADPVAQTAATPAAAWYLVDARNSADVGP